MTQNTKKKIWCTIIGIILIAGGATFAIDYYAQKTSEKLFLNLAVSLPRKTMDSWSEIKIGYSKSFPFLRNKNSNTVTMSFKVEPATFDNESVRATLAHQVADALFQTAQWQNDLDVVVTVKADQNDSRWKSELSAAYTFSADALKKNN